MKKIIAVALSAVFALSMAACAGISTPSTTVDPVETQQQSEIPNPMEEQSSAEAFKALGVTMNAPDDAENVIYYIIGGKLAEVLFTLDGVDYNYRASATESDISGVYDTFTDAFEMSVVYDNDQNITASAKTGAEGGSLVTWTAQNVNYSLYTTGAVDETALRAVVKSVMSKSFSNVADAVSGTDGVVTLVSGSATVIDLNGDGVMETITLEEIPEQSNSLAKTKINISSENGTKAEFVTDMQYMNAGFAYDIDADGLVEVIVSGDECSDDYATWLFRFDGEKIINARSGFEAQEGEESIPATCGGGVIAIDVQNGVYVIWNNVDIIGTWSCTTQYALDPSEFAMKRVDGSVWTNYFENGTVDPEYWSYCTLITVKELPYVADGTTQSAMLPVGEKLVLLDTDGETYFHFETESGIKGTITTARSTDENDWGFYIDGQKEETYFETVPYAG